MAEDITSSMLGLSSQDIFSEVIWMTPKKSGCFPNLPILLAEPKVPGTSNHHIRMVRSGKQT